MRPGPQDPAGGAGAGRGRGFASMSAARLREVSSKGGSAPHAGKRGFALLDDAARQAAQRKAAEAQRADPRWGFAGLEPEVLEAIARRGGIASRQAAAGRARARAAAEDGASDGGPEPAR